MPVNILWSGGYLDCEEQNGHKVSIYKHSSYKDQIKNFFLSNGTINTNAKNPTDADAFLEEIDNNNESHLHLFKSCCTSKMICKYKTNDDSVKLYSNNTNIWFASFENGKFSVACDYNEFTDANVRMPNNSTSNTTKYFMFKNDGIAEYSFRQQAYNNPGSNSTNVGMFSGCTGLIECQVPCEMNIISQETFNGCSSLTSYTKSPEFIISIGERAFSACTSLQELLIPQYSNISTESFAKCSNATTIYWHGLTGNSSTTDTKCNMSSIPDFAFFGCKSLKNTKFKNNNTLNNHIVIPSGIERIGEGSFTSDSESTTPKFETLSLMSVTTIDDNAFRYNTTLKTINNLGNVTSIGQNAFSGCTSLTSIELANNTGTNISSYAFNNCTSLSSITIHKNCTISSSAFSGCTALSAITLDTPVNSVSSMNNCFSSFSGTVNIYCNNDYIDDLNDAFNTNNAINFYVSSAYINDYLPFSSNYWKFYTYN